MNPIAKLGLAAVCVALGACSMLEPDKIDYKSATRAPTLEVPPDLTQLSRESRYAGGSVTASGYQGAALPAGTANTAPSRVGDARIERAGGQRWLVVARPADALWSPVRDFWQENGFLLSVDQANLGIMETDWAENRAKLPQDFIRSTIGKVFDSAYSTGERDRFRTRMERTADGSTEIYISHRGMLEVYNNTQKDQTVWQPRPADAELEAEFLRRLMVKLSGAPAAGTAAAAATEAPRQSARITTVDNLPALQLDEPFDRAWRRVGLSLDRTGFTVEDRDRAQGTYFVRYVTPEAAMDKPGLLGRLFRSSDATPPVKYRIVVRGASETAPPTTVRVQDAGGKPETSAAAQRIVQVIADDLK